jgi:uncharacterized protein YbjT (DUF2867 family)
MNTTALIIGATGLTGSNLLQQLLNDEDFTTVKIFVRTATGITHRKIQENIIDFNAIENIKENITGDVLFSCLGTTIKQAGSRENQYMVDFTYQYAFAKHAADNGVNDYVLVSSASANAKSMFFYTKIKGELEQAVKKLPFLRIRILQPSILQGERKNKRTAEDIGVKIIDTLGKILPFLEKYRSITGEELARAMITIYKKQDSSKIKIYELDELFFENKKMKIF